MPKSTKKCSKTGFEKNIFLKFGAVNVTNGWMRDSYIFARAAPPVSKGLLRCLDSCEPVSSDSAMENWRTMMKKRKEEEVQRGWARSPRTAEGDGVLRTESAD